MKSIKWYILFLICLFLTNFKTWKLKKGSKRSNLNILSSFLNFKTRKLKKCSKRPKLYLLSSFPRYLIIKKSNFRLFLFILLPKWQQMHFKSVFQLKKYGIVLIAIPFCKNNKISPQHFTCIFKLKSHKFHMKLISLCHEVQAELFF